MYAAGAATPKHDYVPWLVINGVHDETTEDAALNDLVGYICSLNTSSPACKTEEPESMKVIVDNLMMTLDNTVTSVQD